MDKILNNGHLSKIEITGAIEKNFSDFFIEVSQLNKSTVHIGNDYKWVKGKELNWPAGIFDIRLEPRDVDEKLRQITEEIKCGNLPGLVMTGPSTRPDDFHLYFENHGFIKKSEAIGMALDLNEMKFDFDSVSNLKINELKDEESLFNWAHVVCLGLFKVKESQVESFHNTVKNLEFNNKFKFFLGTYEGKAVASSLLYLSSGVAGIYHVATLPEYRGKGIGKQITLAPLYYAKEKGYKIATLQATLEGEAIYKKIGFEEYCRLGRYRVSS